uniref:3-hydroxy-3-methylglutaryl coenzyme A reductase n=1 Tax=Cyanotis arachnoidea TaxID=1503182 RepID=A0A060AG04_9LILI|nr:3-hydroxy-3-methylglutaryl coenzyme A reductase [Cyanotis arachnoidea]
MDVRRRLPPRSAPNSVQNPPNAIDPDLFQASDALPLPIRHTNLLFSALFVASLVYLMRRWRQKIRSFTPLHFLSFPEIVAIVGLVASLIYLLSFFGIAFVQSFVSSHDDDDEFILSAKQIKTEIAHQHGLVEENVVKIIKNKTIVKISEEELALPACKLSACQLVQESVAKGVKSNALVEISDEDAAIVAAVVAGDFPSYQLESKLKDCRRAAGIRKEAIRRTTGKGLEGLPLDGFDYDSILGQCCELPIGFVQLPVGVAGPLVLDGEMYFVPMATTEGCLVASTNRGCKAIAESGGATSVLLKDGMTRAPVVKFPSATRAAELKAFLEDPNSFETVSLLFNRSSRFARLQSIKCAIAGRNLYMRFCCSTGDAMGMNMVSKGVQNVIDFLQTDFPDMDVISISGNYCADKKPAAVNWIEGRGKSVVCEAVIKEEVVKKILKTNVAALVELNTIKNLAGSAIAGALGGFNAHASNIVSAIYIATGQDPAQNVESSQCITMVEATNDGKDLHISVTMPSVEVGTVGGGTQLASQAACLDLLGVKGSSLESPGANARRLATIVAGSVLAGELSLLSALAANHLVKSHMKYNRSTKDFSKSSS